MAVFTTTVLKDSVKSATGIQVPPEIIAELGAGKKPKVKISLNGYTYRSTVAVLGGAFMVPLNAEHRQAAGVKAGSTVEVNLNLDTEPRTVEVPQDLSAALAGKPGAQAAFDRLPFSLQKEYVRQVVSTRAEATRTGRIFAILSVL
jgi:hypothetical protein